MKIVLLEPLGITEEKLSALVQPLLNEGHTFTALPKNSAQDALISSAEDADACYWKHAAARRGNC